MIKTIRRYQHDARDWWQAALDDLRYAEGNLAMGFYSQVCFLAQQAGEKALKAYLLSQDIVAERTHKLVSLVSQVSKKSKKFSSLSDSAKVLDRYYLGTRYPDVLGGEFGAYDKETAEDALKLANEVVNFLKPMMDKTP